MDAGVKYRFNIVNCEKLNSQFNFGKCFNTHILLTYYNHSLVNISCKISYENGMSLRIY